MRRSGALEDPFDRIDERGEDKQQQQKRQQVRLSRDLELRQKTKSRLPQTGDRLRVHCYFVRGNTEQVHVRKYYSIHVTRANDK